MSSRKFNKLKGFLVFIVTVAVLAGGLWAYLRNSGEPPIKFLTTPAERGDLRSVILATGKVQPVSLISVGTQISGTLKELYVDFNSVVKKGQLIALIDPESQEADLSQATASLEAAEADAAEARANLENTVRKLARSKALYASDLISLADLELDESNRATAEARLMSSGARVEQQRANVLKARLQLGYTRIYSPVDGVVVTKNVDVGQTVAASFNTPTIAEIAEDLSRMKVEVNIDEADIGSVHEGQKVEFTVDAFQERRFTGAVSQIRLSPTAENNVISYKAIVSFVNDQIDGQNLIPGMTANVTLIVEEKTDVVKVPNAALRFRPLSGGESRSNGLGSPRDAANAVSQDEGRSRSSVYKLENGKPLKIDVKSGITDGADTEILTGVEPGVEVIVGIDAPRDA